MMASPDGTAKAVDGNADLANGHEEDHIKPKIDIEDPEELDDTKPIDGAETATPAATPVPAKDGAIAPQPQQERVMELQDLALKVFYAWLGLLVLSVLVLWLWSWELIRSLAFGLVLGLGASLLHRWNIKRKVRMAQVLNLVPGRRGMDILLRQVPTWLSFAPSEKVAWLNDIIAKVWPFYDYAISELIKTQVEPLMNEYKPPGLIKRIYFQKLTLGSSPVRVEGIRIDDADPAEIALEADFRWSGDANIVMGIELPLGGSFTRMAPKVSDLAVSGTARIVLRPLVDTVPGFGAALVSLRVPPIVRFHLNFGKAFGGAASAGAIRLWLDDFLRSQVAEMMLWPARIVVPILDEAVTGPLDDLYLRHKGALRVEVVEARDLPKVDALGSADAFAEVFTTAHVREKTKTKKNSLSPKWDETLWLMVQEPLTQNLYVVVKDVDLVNFRSLLQLNVLKGATDVVKNTSLLGRVLLPLHEVTSRPGEEHDMWLPLGTGDFASATGCGTGCGEIHLVLTFWPFDLLKGHRAATRGAVIVTLICCDNLIPADRPINSSDPFVEFELHKKKRKSTVQWRTLEPRWIGEHFDWFHVPQDSILELTVYDFDRWSSNEVLGSLEIDITEEVARAPKGDVTRTWELEDVPLDWMAPGQTREKSTITMRIQWIPYAEQHRGRHFVNDPGHKK